jgi:outer membrane protein OmpA-like peptidoglycan-associated protein
MTMPNSRVLFASSLSMGLLVGCATLATDPMIENARQKVMQVQVDEEAVRYAQPDIARAQQLMYAADQAIKDGYTDLAKHDAYLANQIACAAEQSGKEHAALDRIAAGESERQQIQLDARDREASAGREHDRAQIAEQNAQNSPASAGQATMTSQDLQSELEGLNAQQSDRGLVVNFGDELFDTDKASLKPGVNHALDQLAQVLNAHPERRVLAEAHSDGAGSNDNAPDLSQRRASALKDALVQRGVSADRIDVAGPGSEGTVASSDNSGGGQPIRWVQVIISDQTGSVASR